MATPSGGPVDRLAVDRERAGAELGQARDAAQQRGLAAAARADDAHNLVALRSSSDSWRNATTVPSRNSLLALSATMTGPTPTVPLPASRRSSK